MYWYSPILSLPLKSKITKSRICWKFKCVFWITSCGYSHALALKMFGPGGLFMKENAYVPEGRNFHCVPISNVLLAFSHCTKDRWVSHWLYSSKHGKYYTLQLNEYEKDSNFLQIPKPKLDIGLFVGFCVFPILTCFEQTIVLFWSSKTFFCSK